MDTKGTEKDSSTPPGPNTENGKPSGQQPVSAMGLDEYLGDFMVEFKENLVEMNRALDQLLANPANRSLLDILYRDAHNLKGGSNALGFLRLGDFLRQIEISFEPARKRGEPFTMELGMALKSALAILEKAAREAEQAKNDTALDFNAAAEALKAALAGSSRKPGADPS